MSNINTEGLPPEMQARIADIIQQAKASAIQPVGQQAPVAPPAAPVARPPSLMDHIIALRQEVAELRQQVHASGQVTEAVGNAVGSLYSMFQEQTEPSSYSSQFQEAPSSMNDDY